MWVADKLRKWGIKSGVSLSADVQTAGVTHNSRVNPADVRMSLFLHLINSDLQLSLKNQQHHSFNLQLFSFYCLICRTVWIFPDFLHEWANNSSNISAANLELLNLNMHHCDQWSKNRTLLNTCEYRILKWERGAQIFEFYKWTQTPSSGLRWNLHT